MAVRPENNQSLIGSIQGEVAAEASPMLQFLSEYAKLIFFGVALLIVVVLGVGLYVSHEADARAEREREFGRLTAGKTGAERIAALEEYLKTAPSSLHAAAWFAIAETARQEKDYAKTYAAWEQISGLDSSIRPTAVMAMAQALTDQSRSEEALALLESLSGEVGSVDLVNVNSRIAILAENMGLYDRAIAAAEVISAAPGGGGDVLFWSQKISALRQKAAAAAPAQ